MKIANSIIRILDEDGPYIDKLILKNNYYTTSPYFFDIKIGTIGELIIYGIPKYHTYELNKLIGKVIDGGKIELHNVVLKDFYYDGINKINLINSIIFNVNGNVNNVINNKVKKIYYDTCYVPDIWSNGYYSTSGGYYTGTGYYDEDNIDLIFHGIGIMEYDNFFVYKGGWCMVNINGYGKMKFYMDYCKYKGEWLNNKINGYGTLSMKSDNLKYTGHWHDNGELTCIDENKNVNVIELDIC